MASTSFEEFKKNIKGTVATENDPEYDIRRWAENSIRKAKYVVFPVSSEDVSRAILFATQQNLDLAIKCGGHSTSGASSSDGGLVIDLSRNLKSITIDTEKRLAYVQGGALSGAWKAKSFEYGLSGCYGLEDSVGVGGLATGGGIGNQVGERGMTSDTIVGATVVVANGDILKASEEENPDLFWGIRGGGPNFGIVTEFVFQLYPQRPDVYSCFLVFSPKSLSAVVDEINEWQKTQQPDETVELIMVSCPDGEPVIVFSGFKNSSEKEGTESFARFIALSPMANNSRQVPFYDPSKPQKEDSDARFKINGGTSISSAPADVVQRTFEAWQSMISQFSTTVRSTVRWKFYDMAKVASMPVDATAFTARNKDMYISISVRWDNEDFTSQASTEAKKLVEAIKPSPAKPSGAPPPKPGPFDGARKGFGPNYERMRQVKKKYDPLNKFDKFAPVEPAE